ncbi:hypothetical protein BH11PSE11_BH11PSE11_13000 [soil metagenome]
MMVSRAKHLLSGLLSAGVLTLAGCNTVGQSGTSSAASADDPKVVVATRAEERWKALMVGNVNKAYEYFSPATREIMPFSVYQAKLKPGLWRAIKVKSVVCEAELCKAALLLTYDLRDIKGMEMDLEESWIKEGGNWWYVQKK